MNAPEKAFEIKAAITAVFVFCTALWGWLGWVILALLFCIIFDYATGTWAAKSKGEWSSAVAREGLWHKLGEIIALLVATCVDITINVLLHMEALDTILPVELPSRIPFYFTLMVAMWYIFTELGSIIENAAKLGAPIPEWLSKSILKLKENTDATAENIVPDPHLKE